MSTKTISDRDFLLCQRGKVASARPSPVLGASVTNSTSCRKSSALFYFSVQSDLCVVETSVYKAVEVNTAVRITRTNFDCYFGEFLFASVIIYQI